MTAKDFNEDDSKAAELALAAAQRMPVGPERIAALKRAGQMRFIVYRREQADLALRGREIDQLRRGHPRPATNERGPS
jgi:hypothetical protein